MADDIKMIVEWLAEIAEKVVPQNLRLRDTCVSQWDYNFSVRGANEAVLLVQITEHGVDIRGTVPLLQSKIDPSKITEAYNEHDAFSWRDKDVVGKVVWSMYNMLKDMERIHLTLKCREHRWVPPSLKGIEKLLCADSPRMAP